MDSFKLSDAKLKQYGLAIVALRRNFEKDAMEVADPHKYPNVNA